MNLSKNVPDHNDKQMTVRDMRKMLGEWEKCGLITGNTRVKVCHASELTGSGNVLEVIIVPAEIRLIDANAQISKLDEMMKSGEYDCDSIAYIKSFFDKAPTVDAEPVEHAHWESWGYVFHGIEWKRCSRCGKCADVSYNGILEGEIRMATPAQCGCCGAKMDEE